MANRTFYSGFMQSAAIRRNRHLREAQYKLMRLRFLTQPTTAWEVEDFEARIRQERYVLLPKFRDWMSAEENLKLVVGILREEISRHVAHAREYHREWRRHRRENLAMKAELAAIDNR